MKVDSLPNAVSTLLFRLNNNFFVTLKTAAMLFSPLVYKYTVTAAVMPATPSELF